MLVRGSGRLCACPDTRKATLSLQKSSFVKVGQLGKLRQHHVGKPWGVSSPPAPFGRGTGEEPLGEIWFESQGEEELPLLVKYLFTSERLSVQVHPDDEQAKVRGHPNGKTECWYILDAEPGAEVGLGLRAPLSREALRNAAIDGSIEQLLDWKPARRGDFFFVPAGTVHAIGGGLTLVEVQQQSDVTYRLYDYGRPRELHLDDAVAVADLARYDPAYPVQVPPTEAKSLVRSPMFQLDHWFGAGRVTAHEGQRRWVIPLEGEANSGGETVGPGECMVVNAAAELRADGGARLLIASA
jgi:mannose-6-phosphate isomerase